MLRPTRLLIVVIFGLNHNCVFAQSPPPGDLLTRDTFARGATAETSRSLSQDQSERRLVEAAQQIGNGKFDTGLELLKGFNFDVPDKGIVNVLRAHCYLGRGELRKALNEMLTGPLGSSAETIADAPVIKSRVFFQAKVLPLSYYYAKQALQIQTGNKDAAQAIKFFDKNGGGGFSRVSSVSPKGAPEYQIELWRETKLSGKSAGPSRLQPVVLVLRRGEDFRGALAMESRSEGRGVPPVFELRFYDLEGRPIALTRLRNEAQAEQVLQKYSIELNPRFGKGGFTIMRAELEASTWYELDVAPFAAAWASYAIQNGGIRSKDIQIALQAKSAWNWTYEGRFEAGRIPDPMGGSDKSLYLVVGYSNSSMQRVEELRNTEQAVEVFHFPLLASGAAYLDSYVLTSETLSPSERVYVLKRAGGGDSELIDLFDQRPTYQEVAEKVKNHLDDSTKKAIERARQRPPTDARQ